MAEFEKRTTFLSNDLSFHLSLRSENQNPRDYDPVKHIGEEYTHFELIALGRGRIEDGLNRVYEAMGDAKESEAGEMSIDQAMNPRRMLDDELDALTESVDEFITH